MGSSLVGTTTLDHGHDYNVMSRCMEYGTHIDATGEDHSMEEAETFAMGY
jgi:hypothetical protein